MKILFATDGAKQSTYAVDALARLNIGDGDRLHVITVIDMAVPMSIDIYGGYLPDTTEYEKAARENAQTVINAAIKQFEKFFKPKNVELSSEILFGSPDSRIVETAEQMGADLIVIGSHGHSRWERLLLGSVSDSVVHHAPCSVLIVRTPKS